MTSTTLDTVASSPVAAPRGARAAVVARVAAYTGSVVEDRRAVRAYRRQERALAGARGSELGDLHALARRG